MFVTNTILDQLQKLGWEYFEDSSYYSVTLSKKELLSNNILFYLTGLDFSTICRINEDKDIYVELLYTHILTEKHILTLNLYICPDRDSIGEIVFSDVYVNNNSVDFLDLFNASDYDYDKTRDTIEKLREECNEKDNQIDMRDEIIENLQKEIDTLKGGVL